MSHYINTAKYPGKAHESTKTVLNIIAKEGTYRVIITDKKKWDKKSTLYLVSTGTVKRKSFHNEWICSTREIDTKKCMKTIN